jgi:hypothetical protein
MLVRIQSTVEVIELDVYIHQELCYPSIFCSSFEGKSVQRELCHNYSAFVPVKQKVRLRFINDIGQSQQFI